MSNINLQRHVFFRSFHSGLATLVETESWSIYLLYFATRFCNFVLGIFPQINFFCCIWSLFLTLMHFNVKFCCDRRVHAFAKITFSFPRFLAKTRVAPLCFDLWCNSQKFAIIILKPNFTHYFVSFLPFKVGTVKREQIVCSLCTFRTSDCHKF